MTLSRCHDRAAAAGAALPPTSGIRGGCAFRAGVLGKRIEMGGDRGPDPACHPGMSAAPRAAASGGNSAGRAGFAARHFGSTADAVNRFGLTRSGTTPELDVVQSDWIGGEGAAGEPSARASSPSAFAENCPEVARAPRPGPGPPARFEAPPKPEATAFRAESQSPALPTRAHSPERA